MNNNEWHLVRNVLPKEGETVECTTPSGHVVELVRRGRMWFAGEMYVYYLPVSWRYKS